MSLFGGTGDGGASALEAQRQSTIRQGEQEIDKNFAGFTPQFYQNYGNAVVGAQNPQLQEQYRQTGKNLTFALARGGNLKGSVAQQEQQSLNNTLATNESTLANQAANAVNSLKQNVQTQKGNLTNQLTASQDIASTAEAAAANAAADRAPSAIQPLGNLFADWSNAYLSGKTAQAFNQNGAGSGGNAWFGLTNQGYGSA